MVLELWITKTYFLLPVGNSMQAAKVMAKIDFLVLKYMFKGRQMKIESLLAAIAH